MGTAGSGTDTAGALRAVYREVLARDRDRRLFTSAVRELLADAAPVLAEHPELVDVLGRVCEPERLIVFRVPWVDDTGRTRVNRGYRVQFSSALGPYKGGLRFTPGVDADTIAFLGFEQVFKNALTGLELGAGKGGADFAVKDASPGEVMRFCQSFVTELGRHIGSWTDVPAGDQGVGDREIGWMLGQYQRLAGRHEAGTLTGKPVGLGGSRGRSEATGHGVVHFARRMLAEQKGDLEGLRVVVSGSGNVARHAMTKVAEYGGLVVACSDSTGALHDPDGVDVELLAQVKAGGGTVGDYAARRDGAEVSDCSPFTVACDVALPCATQNELDADAARALVANGCTLVAEGANGPVTPRARRVLRDAGVPFGPGKAANAGGVAVSGLEMRQNAGWTQWPADDVAERLAGIMADIHDRVRDAAERYHGDPTDYERGANAAGFLRVAQAVAALGVV